MLTFLACFGIGIVYVVIGFLIAVFWDAFDEFLNVALPATFWMIVVYLMTWPVIVLWFFAHAAFSMPEEDRPVRDYDNHGSE